ncbi:hypothetical protein EN871_30280 [bacterium M00.F.Ca.ET.228.01.1.1]|uniref:Putative transmembrane protein n=1 Tax=Burkholderia sp. (strain CCGE1003) TaxID=640512 RepID=E1T8L7_BURSG|nr:hypothetical protein EN871_30280 [bacterium M00.F.Ca.ET.228.01.1.1]TGR95988.1 hypothetical protein EN834_29885 [bacterium M00.F.Ca.ET.191.01.1.1]TGT97093.1 hypothetical protein EN798_29895 [bacterium M00.F.Ca.ET.155.01.1.1]
MLRSAILVGLLLLPGSFFVLALACVHPRLRKEIVRMSRLSNPLTQAGLVHARMREKLLLRPAYRLIHHSVEKPDRFR